MKELHLKLDIDQLSYLADLYYEVNKFGYVLVDADKWNSLFYDEDVKSFVLKNNGWAVKEDTVLGLFALTNVGEPHESMNSKSILTRVKIKCNKL